MKTSELANHQPLESGGDLINGFSELNYATLLRLNLLRGEGAGGWRKDGGWVGDWEVTWLGK